ncbi:MAG TPA: DUF6390 family protein [Egibacteraceae bacterium]|nr:DUF6390 family protein [Egibacteraceae bacterium]
MSAGAIRFCRYAYAPNALGYCGPDDARAVLEHGAAGVAGPELEQLARGFEGAWPYLELIASSSGIRDPLDERVVAAYWLGGPQLRAVDEPQLGRFVEERFKPRMGRRWSALSDLRLDRSTPHHNFHVFVVYPWIGMLRLGRAVEPLRVLDRCRIRWGVVEDVQGELAEVRSRPLAFDGAVLELGEPRMERVTASAGGLGFAHGLVPGAVVSLHWDWVCERLTASELDGLRRETARALALANKILRRPAGSILG